MKYRQTLIWEFINKTTLRAIDKLKVVCRLDDFFTKKIFNHKYRVLFLRAFELKHSFVSKLTNVQREYYFSLTKRYFSEQISKKEFDNNLKNFFNYYKA